MARDADENSGDWKRTRGSPGGVNVNQKKAKRSNVYLPTGGADLDGNHLKDVEYKQLTYRAGHHPLLKALERLNSTQKEAVVEMGFENLHHLKITDIPARLCYWLLTKFDPTSVELLLDARGVIRIDEDDVWLTLGIPKGNVIMNRKKKRKETDLLIEWRGRIGKDPTRIRIPDICKEMLKEADGGKWFRIHFLILVTCCIIENSSNGYVNPTLIEYFEDLSSIHNLNWCDYLMRALIEHRSDWDATTNISFKGPILFLVALYVDRVVLNNIMVERTFPTICGWNSKLLRQRETMEISIGKFGNGRLIGRFVSAFRPTRTQPCNGKGQVGDEHLDEIDVPLKINDDPTSSVNKDETDETSTMHYINKLMNQARKLAETVTDLVSLTQNTPKHMLDDTCLQRVLQACNDLLGIKKSDECNTVEPSDGNIVSQVELSQIWSNVDWLSSIDKILDAVHVVDNVQTNKDASQVNFASENQSDSDFDVPNFSLGLTQILDDGFVAPDNIVNDDAELDRLDGASNVQVDKNVGLFNKVTITPDVEKVDCVTQATNKEEFTFAPGVLQVFETPDLHVRKSTRKLSLDSPVGPKTTVDLKGKSKKANIGHQMVRRNDTLRITSESLMSPYLVRVIGPIDKLDNTEKDAYFWIFHMDGKNSKDVVFTNNTIILRRSDVETMAPHVFIVPAVINVWSTILNDNESLRAKESPYRFFSTTYPCLNTVCSPSSWLKKADALNRFSERLSMELQRTKGAMLNKIDMFFFPIYYCVRFYVICINMKKKQIEIIDSSTDKEDEPIEVKYGYVPSSLRDVFADFLLRNNMKLKSACVRTSPFYEVPVSWRVRHTKEDCGIYVMRHMETYMGECGANWDAGFKKRSTKQMRYLRVKYLKCILCSRINLLAERNKENAHDHYRMSCDDRKISVEKLLMEHDARNGK